MYADMIVDIQNLIVHFMVYISSSGSFEWMWFRLCEIKTIKLISNKRQKHHNSAVIHGHNGRSLNLIFEKRSRIYVHYTLYVMINDVLMIENRL